MCQETIPGRLYETDAGRNLSSSFFRKKETRMIVSGPMIN